MPKTYWAMTAYALMLLAAIVVSYGYSIAMVQRQALAAFFNSNGIDNSGVLFGQKPWTYFGLGFVLSILALGVDDKIWKHYGQSHGLSRVKFYPTIVLLFLSVAYIDLKIGDILVGCTAAGMIPNLLWYLLPAKKACRAMT